MAQNITPLQKRMAAAIPDLLKNTPFVRGGWIPDDCPPGMSESTANKLFAFHIKGETALGPITLHVFFDDVDKKKGTFKIRRQVLFTGTNGELEPGQEDHCPQVFWGGSLGWRVAI